MALYLAFWRVSLQDAVQYRAEAAIWFLYDILPPIMMMFLWLAAYETQATVAGFDLSAMLGYTLAVMVLRAATTQVEWDVATAVYQGTLSMHLVRPFNVWGYWLVQTTAWRAVRVALAVPVVLTCVVWLGPHLGTPSLSWERLPWIAASLTVAFVAGFFLKLCLGFSAFWLTDILGISTLYEVVVYVFGGMLLPLDLLPEPLRVLAALLPFQYLYYIPLSVLLGRLDGPDLTQALLTQLGWTCVLAPLAYALWRRGLRRYEAVGG